MASGADTEQLAAQLGGVAVDGSEDQGAGAVVGSEEFFDAEDAPAAAESGDPETRAHAFIDDDRLLQAQRVLRAAGRGLAGGRARHVIGCHRIQ